MSEINEHKDYSKPYYVAKNEENTDFRCGKITQGQVFSTSMPIKTFSKNEDMISFIEENGGTYTDDEIGEEVYSPNIPDS
jgi:hypothetical protein